MATVRTAAATEIIGDLDDFKETVGWQIVRQRIQLRIEAHKSALSSPTTTATMDEVRGLQKAIADLQWCLGIPDREIERLQKP